MISARRKDVALKNVPGMCQNGLAKQLSLSLRDGLDKPIVERR
jgi:hypothetical protein